MTKWLLLSFLVVAGCHSSRAKSGSSPTTQQPTIGYRFANVRVTVHTDKTIFPIWWQTKRLKPTADALPAHREAVVIGIIQGLLQKYPTKMLDSYLDCVHLVSNLTMGGYQYGGASFDKDIFISVDDSISDAEVPRFVERTFHAEFATTLLYRYQGRFDEQAWRRANLPGFEYLGSGLEAIRQGKASVVPDAFSIEHGFLDQYAQAAIREDLTEMIVALFMADDSLWRKIDASPVLKKKRELAESFLHAICPTLDSEYFERLHLDGRARLPSGGWPGEKK